MASMSYCLFENTSDDLASSVRKLMKFRSLEHLRAGTNEYEFVAAKHLARLCAEYLEVFEQVEAGEYQPEEDEDY